MLYPFHFFQRKQFEKKYTEFLTDNNGKNFFCYNNRKNSKIYIEEQIIPNLTDGIEIVYLNGKKVESEYNVKFISEALYKLKNYSRFPHLMKIRNGKLIDKSINNQFYNVLNLNKPKNELLTQINLFFELTEIKNIAEQWQPLHNPLICKIKTPQPLFKAVMLFIMANKKRF